MAPIAPLMLSSLPLVGPRLYIDPNSKPLCTRELIYQITSVGGVDFFSTSCGQGFDGDAVISESKIPACSGERCAGRGLEFSRETRGKEPMIPCFPFVV